MCSRSGLFGVILVSATLKKASLCSLTLLLAQIIWLCCPALCILMPTQAPLPPATTWMPQLEHCFLLFTLLFFVHLGRYLSICLFSLLFSFTPKCPFMSFNWCKASKVIRIVHVFTVSQFMLILPNSWLFTGVLFLGFRVLMEFLQNLWFKDEQGGEFPIVHILFFSLQRSKSKWNTGKCSEQLVKMPFWVNT